jgi:hypothetical protein
MIGTDHLLGPKDQSAKRARAVPQNERDDSRSPRIGIILLGALPYLGAVLSFQGPARHPGCDFRAPQVKRDKLRREAAGARTPIERNMPRSPSPRLRFDMFVLSHLRSAKNIDPSQSDDINKF